MFLHEFGEDFVLALELLFQGGDPAILVIAGTSGPGLERGGGVLEEILLPATEHGGVDAVPITEVRDGGVFEEMEPKDGGLLLDGESFPSLLGPGRAFARGCSLFEQTACPISTEAKHPHHRTGKRPGAQGPGQSVQTASLLGGLQPPLPGAAHTPTKETPPGTTPQGPEARPGPADR